MFVEWNVTEKPWDMIDEMPKKKNALIWFFIFFISLFLNFYLFYSSFFFFLFGNIGSWFLSFYFIYLFFFLSYDFFIFLFFSLYCSLFHETCLYLLFNFFLLKWKYLRNWIPCERSNVMDVAESSWQYISTIFFFFVFWLKNQHSLLFSCGFKSSSSSWFKFTY